MTDGLFQDQLRSFTGFEREISDCEDVELELATGHQTTVQSE
jgi:hypothetical protein